MFTWWEVFHKAISSKLFILSIYEENQLIGLAPFHIVGSFPKSLIQGRTITFIGCGEESKDKIVSPFATAVSKMRYIHLVQNKKYGKTRGISLTCCT